MTPTKMRLIVFFTCLTLAASAYAQSPREQLQQMTVQLQQTPNDTTLRERIIKLGAEMKPAPAVPEEARRAFVRGNTAMTEAKTPDEYVRAVDLYKEAIAIAPWWGRPYFNLSKAHELRQEYDRAILALKFYMLTTSSEEEAREAQDYSYVLEEKRDRQAKADDTRKRAEAQQLQRQVWAKDLVQWMTENYGRSLLGKVQYCFYCTDEDARGSKWTYAAAILPGGSTFNPNLSQDWSRLGTKLSFRTAGQANDEIVFSGVANNGVMSHDYCGTVNGPRPEDIKWKACGDERNLFGYGQATSAIFTTSSNGKPMVRIKDRCRPDGHCSHANLVLD